MHLAGTSPVDSSFQQNLQQVDEFIADCERHLKAEPQDELAREYLSNAYQQKAELLSAMMDREGVSTNMGIEIMRFASCGQASSAGCCPCSGPLLFCARVRLPLPPQPLINISKSICVNGRPVVVIHNVANGRIEVKSWKNAEVDVLASQTSDKIGFEMEQVGDRIDVTANVLDASAQPTQLAASLQLTVPEETELQLKTETGLIYVEQVMGDMTLESVAGDVHLKEVSATLLSALRKARWSARSAPQIGFQVH